MHRANVASASSSVATPRPPWPPLPLPSSPSALDNLHRLDPTSPDLTSWLNHHMASLPVSPSSSLTPLDRLATTSEALRDISLYVSAEREAARTDIQRIINHLVATVPKLGLDINIAMQAARSLQAQLKHADATALPPHHRIRPSPPTSNVDHSLSRIRSLSLLNSSLTSARNALREAQAWSTLQAQVHSSLSHQRYSEAVDRIVKARGSLSIFSTASPSPSSSSSRQDRVELLQTLTSAIEAHLLPLLEHSIRASDVDTTITVAHQLVRLGRCESAFCQTYFTTRRAEAVRNWSMRNADVATAPTSLLDALFGDVLALLGEERIYADRIFQDKRQAAELLLSSLFDALQPNLSAYLRRFERLDGVEEQLEAVVKAYQSVEAAAKSVQEMLPPPTTSTPALADKDDSRTDTASPSSSSPASVPPVPPISDVSKIPSVAPPARWDSALLSPFSAWQTNLVTLEAQALSDRLDAVSRSPSADPATRLLDLVTSALDGLYESLRRSRALTRGYATAPLMDLIETVFCSLLDGQSREMRSYGHQVVERIGERVRGRTTPTTTTGGYEDRKEDLTSQDWDDFQRGTKVVAACRDVSQLLERLEREVAKGLVETGKSVPRHTFEDLACTDTDVEGESTATMLDKTPLNSPLLRQKIEVATRYLLSPTSPSPLLSTRASLYNLVRTVQTYLHDLLLSPFSISLNAYAALSLWTATRHPGAVNEYNLVMPTFSLSPTETMARVGEGLMNLPRLVEVYAEEEWVAFHDDDQETPSIRTGKGHGGAFSTSSQPSLPSGSSSSSSLLDHKLERTTEQTLSLFLSSLLDRFLNRFCNDTMYGLPTLSEVGRRQLVTDLEYLVNICAALNDEAAAARVRRWKRAIEDVHSHEDAERDEQGEEEVKRIFARLRGAQHA